jgi:two-component system, cell cycle response regulator DivK
MLDFKNPSAQSNDVITPITAKGTDAMTNRGKGKPRLLVLDNTRYQKLFDAVLGSDFELLTTDDAGHAVLLASTENPDLILLSYSVENSDGIMVAKEIRETAGSPAPILLMLTSDRPTLRRQATNAGCNGFLIKPIDPEKLRAQIADWLKPAAESESTG